MEGRRTQQLFFSENGVKTRSWGKQAWRFIHVVAMNYPLNPSDEDVASYFSFFQSLCHILPCKFCRKHFCTLTRKKGGAFELKKSLFCQKKTDAPGTARERLFMYTLRLHNCINIRLKKKDVKSVEHWGRYYAKFRA